MQQKINILIITATITLLGLVGIQAYLIYNTYELKKEAFLTETRRAIGRIDDESELIGEVEDQLNQHFMELLWEYKYQDLTKEQLVPDFIRYRDSINTTYNTLYQQELKKANVAYDIKFKKNVAQVVLLDSIANDTILNLEEGNHMLLLGENFGKSQGYNVSRAFIASDYINPADSLGRSIDFRLITYDRMNISEWKTIVLGRMTLVFIVSVLLLLFVVGLFYYSISNLIKQKKVADVKTDFINNITHELKTPLATLAIVTKSLKKQEVVTSPKNLANTLGILERQNSRLHKLIDQVTTNSLGSEDIIVQRERVLHNTYIENIITDFSLSIEKERITVHTDIAPEEVFLNIDTFLCTTALLNILENAVKYGKASTMIHMKTQLRGQTYQIEIKDNGIGIEAAHQKLIFDKFYRVTQGNVHDVKGLGLGLYYTKQVICAHHGTIDLISEPNKGSKFIITLPLN
ncbi:sensor histidine kinase [Spongiimicrobium salis]|uniref:sensor histidine kinase n=1 Tax=Spongiimicrobium salis TaxID=1667022 RepID=UPI00374DB12D